MPGGPASLDGLAVHKHLHAFTTPLYFKTTTPSHKPIGFVQRLQLERQGAHLIANDLELAHSESDR